MRPSCRTAIEHWGSDLYVPKHFELDAQSAAQLVASRGAGELVTVGPDGPESTFLPFSYDPTAGEFGTLKTHVTRVNPQWQHAGPALVIVHGFDSYISPDWMADANDPRPNLRGEIAVVPTWNYLTVHLRGQLIAHEDPAWIESSLGELVTAQAPEWDLQRISADKIHRLMRAIVGVEIAVSEITGKAKMSQNRSSADITSIAQMLMEHGHSTQTAEFLREVSLPHAIARENKVAEARLANRRS